VTSSAFHELVSEWEDSHIANETHSKNLHFILCYISTPIYVVHLRETSASDIGVSGGEETSLLSLLCLDSKSLFTVIIGVR
jgi:hypothetical protein